MQISENSSSCVKQTVSGPPKERLTASGRTVGSVILNGPGHFLGQWGSWYNTPQKAELCRAQWRLCGDMKAPSICWEAWHIVIAALKALQHSQLMRSTSYESSWIQRHCTNNCHDFILNPTRMRGRVNDRTQTLPIQAGCDKRLFYYKRNKKRGFDFWGNRMEHFVFKSPRCSLYAKKQWTLSHWVFIWTKHYPQCFTHKVLYVIWSPSEVNILFLFYGQEMEVHLQKLPKVT